MTHRLTTNYAKNYCNRTLTVKVIVENVVTCFLGTRCSWSIMPPSAFHTWHIRVLPLRCCLQFIQVRVFVVTRPC